MHKIYPIHQSPLYSIVGLNQLEKRLGIKLNKLDKLLKPNSYRVWTSNNGAKSREIQHPVGWLGDVHKRIANYFSRIETPDYVHSKKTRSYITNANEHKGYHPVAKTDISGFYPNTDWQMVKNMFEYQFNCAKDVSRVLANICCYRQAHLPTGSSLSGYIAFFANKKMFDEVEKVAKIRGCIFTLYVDDLTFSGSAASKSLINEVGKIIKYNGMRIKKAKTQTFSPLSAKTITGVIVRGNKLLLPNKRLKNIYDIKIKIIKSVDEQEKKQLKKSLAGRMLEVEQIQKVGNGLEITFPELIYS